MLIQGACREHPALWLENDLLRVGVLPQKGADIFEFTHRPSGVQFLMQTPWGLKPPPEGPVTNFLDNYEGGWQELFPNANDACEYRGRSIPFHGEVALLPWQYEVLNDDDEETTLCLSVTCQRTPFRLERTLRLVEGESRLFVEEKVTNIGDEPFEFVWGHHLTLGGGFLKEGCLLECPATHLSTPAQLYEPATACLAAEQDEPWPLALGWNAERIDLRCIPGPEAHTHDDVILRGLKHGFYKVTNPRLGLRFSLEWDVSVFPWLMFWQPYGGAEMPPLTGIYGVGLEPWSSPAPLAQAAAAGLAHQLAPGASRQTELVAAIQTTTG